MYEMFYKKGIADIDFKNEKLDTILKEILELKIKKDYFLKTKYQKTYDLRPDVYTYDPCFLSVLKENNIKELIRKYTLRNLTLSHVQVRIVEDENSYMNWHRDTYYNQQGDLIGKAPAGVKIIYYPCFEESEKEYGRLIYLEGSNRILFPTNAYDNQLFGILNKKVIKPRKNKAILFDTAGLHAVIPENKGKKSIRLIYSFLEKEQIDAISMDSENIHQKTCLAYQKL
jgi:hypothetical protein